MCPWGSVLQGGKGYAPRDRTSVLARVPLLFLFVLLPLVLPFRAAFSGDNKPVHLTESSWRKFPFRLSVVRTLSRGTRDRLELVDYDGDGVSEWLEFFEPGYTQAHGPVPQATFELRDVKRNDLWLFNLLGGMWINGVMLEDALPDLPGKELVVSYGHGDSVYLSVFNPAVSPRYQKTFLLFSKPALARRGVPWFGRAQPALLADLDGDGKKELLLQMTTTHALFPRGLLAFDLAAGKTLWRFDTGVQMLDPTVLVRDLDGDGTREVVTGSDAPANGASMNGTDDLHSYLFILNARSGEPYIIKRFGQRFSGVRALDAEDRTGRIYFAYLEGSGGKENASFLASLTFPDTTVRQKLPLHSGASVVAADLNGDGKKEFLVARFWQRDLTLFGRDFSVLRRRSFEYRSSASPHIETVVDVNRDFRPEIVARLDDRVTLLDSRFQPLAQLPSDHSRFAGLFHERPDRPPLILLVSDRPDGSRIYYLTRLQRQFVWPLPISWQGTLLLIFGVIAVGVGVSVSRRIRSRDATISTLRRALEFVPYGVTFIDENGVITFCNNRARELLSLEDMVVERRAFGRVLSREALRPLRRILEKSFAGQEQRYRHRLALQFPQGRTQQLIVTVTRIAPGRGRSAGRMVILYDPNGCPGGSQGEDWVSIARRVAHEVKNPLSTILLTIQRLQMEYRRRDPASSASYDPFTERIIGRVEYLEKVTQGFLKLLHLENPNFTQCDLRELVAQVVREFELGIPEGVTLQYKVEGEIPRIVADPDQIRSLLENLLANAVAAMADGGMLTVSLRLERRLHFPHTPAGNPRDFVLLRVRDTGCGMPKDVAQALMGEQRDENENNLGIGLTIVAKIVRIHEGFIDVMSEPGAGTTVDVYLPA